MKILKKWHITLLLLMQNTYIPTYAYDINVNAYDITTIKNGTPKNLPNDISFMIADIKYDGETVKILEFGEGPKSYFKGHEKLYGQGKIWQGLWKYLKQFQVPVWYLGNTRSTPYRLRQIASKTFTAQGGRFTRDIEELKKDTLFKNMCHQSYKRDKAQQIGIIVKRLLPLNPTIYKQLKKRYEQFLFLDNVTAPFVGNKYKTAQLFANAGLNNYKPLWQVYEKKYTRNLTNTILQDFPNVDIFVIKPLNAANGWGINIVHKDELDARLKFLFTTPQGILSATPDDAINYWGRDKNTKFLIEEYATSKPITIDNKQFDGTMRVAFILDHYDNAINITFLGSYWKLPIRALDEPGNLTELHKSNVHTIKDSDRPSSAKVSNQDYQHVQEILQEILPKLYMKMIEKTLRKQRGDERPLATSRSYFNLLFRKPRRFLSYHPRLAVPLILASSSPHPFASEYKSYAFYGKNSLSLTNLLLYV